MLDPNYSKASKPLKFHVTPTFHVPKFIQTVSDDTIEFLRRESKVRGLGVQDLIRAVIIPEWTSIQGRAIRIELIKNPVVSKRSIYSTSRDS